MNFVCSHGMLVDLLPFFFLLVYTLINLVVIFNRGVKRVDDSGTSGRDGVVEPRDSACGF